MKSLAIFGDASLADARRCVLSGSELLVWDSTRAQQLVRDGVACTSRAARLSAEDRQGIDNAATAWTKAWGKRPLIDGRSFRELYEWKGVSLWWFAELFLHHSTQATHHVRLIETFRRLLQREAPDEVEAIGLGRVEMTLLERTCTAQRILFHGARGRPPRPRPGALAVSWTSRWNNLKMLAGALKSSLTPIPGLTGTGEDAGVLFLSHAAFWRTRGAAGESAEEEYEHYFDRLIPSVEARPGLRSDVVAVGPRAAFRRRNFRHRLDEWLGLHGATRPYVPMGRFTNFAVFGEVRRVSALCRQAWKTLLRSPSLAEAFAHGGVRFDDLSGSDLAATMLLQLPWAVRSYEEMRAALSYFRPSVVCLYAESSGWGRAAIAACRALEVPSVAIQHGIIYPGYYSYLHGADESDCPIPDRTAVFGEAASRFLSEQGHYPPQNLVVTGSPKFDALLETARRWDRTRLREALGVSEDERLLVVASRYRGIRDTHRSIGSAFAALVAAVEASPRVRMIVKPHPAEAGDDYQATLLALGASRSRLLTGGVELSELLHASDALCTVESLSAVEALVLDRPVLILNSPTNLDEMVERGAALAVPEGQDPAKALDALLFDDEVRAGLAQARGRYISDVARGVDGAATERIVDLIQETARRPGGDGAPGGPSAPAVVGDTDAEDAAPSTRPDR